MTSNNLIKSFRLFFVGILVVFGFIAFASTDASAQRRDRDDRYDNRGYNNDRWDDDDDDDRYNGRDRRGNQSTRFAYQRGYREGLKDGRRASRNNRGGYGGYDNDRGYGNGNRGGWGNNSSFRRAYQAGYQRGYQEGLNRNRNRRNNRGGVGIFGF